MDKINLIFYLFDETDSDYQFLVKEFKEKGFDVYNFEAPAQILGFLQRDPYAVVVGQVKEKQDLINFLTFLKKHQRGIYAGQAKVSSILYPRNKKIESLFHKLGCREILDPQINTKSLKFKIEFWYKSLQSKLPPPDKKEAFIIGDDKPKQNSQKAKKELKPFKNVPAINTESDIWLINKRYGSKTILQKYIVHFEGPSEGLIKWSKCTSNYAVGDFKWQLNFSKDDIDVKVFLPENGTWYFIGGRPEYDWNTGVWKFTGLEPELYFENSNGKKYHRIKANKKSIDVANNSVYADSKKILIDESRNNAIFLKDGNKHQSLDDSENVEDNYNQLGGPLKGKSSTDHLNYKNLEGEADTDHLDYGDLEGKAKTDKYDGHLKGKSKTDQYDGPLDGKSATDRFDDINEGNIGHDHRRSSSLEGSGATDHFEGYLEGSLNKLPEDIEEEPIDDIGVDVNNTFLNINIVKDNGAITETFHTTFVDWELDEMVLEASKALLDADERVSIKVTLDYGKDKLKFTLEGVVQEILFDNNSNIATYSISLDVGFDNKGIHIFFCGPGDC